MEDTGYFANEILLLSKRARTLILKYDDPPLNNLKASALSRLFMTADRWQEYYDGYNHNIRRGGIPFSLVAEPAIDGIQTFLEPLS
jgi:hypothetical protein